jgi:nucleotidyltransferase substrate binding protein (TIGR01987 family)
MTLVLDEVNISPLLMARKKFDLFVKHLTSEQEKAGAIQAFEYCYELSWKTLKKVLFAKGVDTASPRDVFREAAKSQLIDDPEVWFGFLRIRNLTVHTYNEEYSEEVVNAFPQFKKELNTLISRIKALK